MDDPDITIEEYIRLDEEKAHMHAIFYNDALTSEVALSCEPTVSPLNNNQIDFRISFDESDDEDYTKVFPTIAYNDALTSKLDFSEPTVSPQHIDEFDETSLSEYKDNDNDKIDIEADKIDIKQFSRGNVINTDDDAYENGSIMALETCLINLI
ncbi:hypothetical protein Tco_0622054 [Tanacetum coccineum]